ncbi:MAG: tetratricopeptide repeat protein [Spirochaetaceae bacterium]|jgi:tetratricopeptide (TPR) repeat protein|nr:tetratricopeptide repeat protein [Spirochaetaceae bacterium]
MPSLKQLEEFKNTFLNVGNEAGILASRNMLPEQYPLPDSEASGPLPDELRNRGASPDKAFVQEDLFSEAENPAVDSAAMAGEEDSAFPAPDDALDFSAFLNTIPDDLSFPPVEDSGAEAGTPGEDESGSADAGFGIPDELLADFAEDIEKAQGDTGISDAPDSGDFPGNPDAEEALGDVAGFDDAFPNDFSVPDVDFTAADSGDENLAPAGETAGIGGSGDPGGPDGFPNFDAAGMEAGSPEQGLSEGADEAGLELPGEEEFGDLLPAEDSELAAGDLDISIPDTEEESANPEDFSGAPDFPPDIAMEEPLGDSFDTFSPEFGDMVSDAGAKLPDAGIRDVEAVDLEDFSLAGIDDVLSGNQTRPGGSLPGPAGGAAPKAPVKVRRGAAGPEDVEEINLTDEEFARLEETLSGYPLNLRIACEELIAEQAVAPDLMSALIKLLVRRGSAKETATLAGKILGRTITIPKGFEKKTGEELEAEQASFAYIFVRKFLPILRMFLIIAIMAASLFYLAYKFIYTPLHADSIYRIGYERIAAGEYGRANERFSEAFRIRRVKDWFYRYAEAFRDERQYLYAEQKYDELLRFYPRDKKGALDYAALETGCLRNYPKADRIIRSNILDFAVDDREGLIALGDNCLAWGETENEQYENARQAYARLLERYGWEDPIVERMMVYFIRTDNLKEVLPLQGYFLDNPKRKISAAGLSELGGYLLSKRFEEARGVPDAYVERIEGIRDILLRAIDADPARPESYYHLARYYSRFGNVLEERQTLEGAIRAFDAALEENPRRTRHRIDAERQYARILTGAREFFAAEEQLVKGAAIYEDAVERRLLSRYPEGGALYADLGDLEYFVKSGDLEAALGYYHRAERDGWAPAEIRYRMGGAHYQLRQWEPALERFFSVATEQPLNRRLLHALGNVSYQRNNYFAAQGYYNRLLDLLDAERARFPLLSPNERPDHMELAERMMVARNNLAVTLEALAERTGNGTYRSQALGLYAESERAWDAITRNPQTVVRSGAGEFSSPGMNLAYINSRNTLNPVPGFEPQIYIRIDKDVLEPSPWEELAPPGYHLSEQLSPGFR